MIWFAALFAVFVWWFATGVILVAVCRGKDDESGYLIRVLMGLPVLVLGAAGVVLSRDDPSLQGVYTAFTSAILIWGWFELAFLAGVITGPNSADNPEGLTLAGRFSRAWWSIAYSEFALLAVAAVLAGTVLGAANSFAFWTFVVLFSARVFAKLNLFLGVPNINTEFLPHPVRHLTQHFRQAPMNRFFPVSVTLLTAAAACWSERAYAAPAGSGAETGFVLLATLTLLALLEHWFMVLSMRDAALWRWLITSASPVVDTAAKGGTTRSSNGRDKDYIARQTRLG